MAAGAAAVGLRPWAPAVAAASDSPPSYLRRSSYAALSTPAFAAGSATLTLDSVGDLPRLAGRDDAFALEFTSSQPLPPGIQALRHPQLGSFELLLGPVGPAGSSQSYEAIVNRSNLPPAVAASSGSRDVAALPAAPAPERRQPSAPVPPKPARTAVKRLRTRLLRRGLACDVRLAEGFEVRSLAVFLRRGDRVVATAARRRLRGRRRLALHLVTRRRLRAGRYVVEVIAVGPHGEQTTLRRRLTVR